MFLVLEVWGDAYPQHRRTADVLFLKQLPGSPTRPRGCRPGGCIKHARSMPKPMVSEITPLSWALEPGCRILMFMWSLGPGVSTFCINFAGFLGRLGSSARDATTDSRARRKASTKTTLYSTLLYSTLLYSTLHYYTMLYYTILCYAILYYTILYYTILYTIYCILYTIYYILYTIYYILYYTIPYYTILYYTILYYTILYYTIL